MTYIYDQFGIKRKVSDINAVERLIKLKYASGADPWPVIEECIKVWESTNPKEWKSFLYELQETRDTRRNEFASSDPRKDEVYGGIIRYTLDIPEKVMYMIRCIYDAEELPMDRAFFRAWGKRFPRMKVAKRI